MLKKVLCVLLCGVFMFTAGCAIRKDELSGEKEADAEVSSEPVKKEVSPYVVNPLTGIKDLPREKENYRPVAITVNNISVAQPVQTGLYNADVVYETEVEGGITRLVAVFKDITDTPKIGTVRSARYPFIDLAMGHGAIYVHHGQDEYHAGAHLKDVDRFVVDENAGGVRVSNGLAREHTLYAYGDKLWEQIKAKGIKTETTNNSAWVKFEDEETDVTFETPATSVSVPFSNSYKTTFNYDSESGKYTRYFNGNIRNDYVTGESIKFKNIFVLYTTIRTYPNCNDGKNHKEVMLQSGSGYYCVNGTCIPINWSKGAASSGFKFTNTDGSELKVNVGNSWVCLADSTRSQAVIQ